MERQQEQQFTLADIQGALEALDVDAQRTVLAALYQQAERRQSEKENGEREVQQSMVRFAATYERATAENASDRNIAGWYEDVDTEAVHVLGLFAQRQHLSDVEESVRNTAALSYIYLALEHSLEWDAELLVNAGVNPDDMLATFKAGVVAAHHATGGEAAALLSTIVDDTYKALDDFDGNLSPAYWKQIVQPSGVIMRAKLVAAGFALPELNEAGMYGDDDDPMI